MPTPSHDHELRGMRDLCFSHAGRRTDTNTVGTQSRRDTAAPRHPSHLKSTGPAAARPGPATLPATPCTALHSRASTRPIADNRHSEHAPVRRHTHKHWQTTAAPTHTSMLQRVPGRGSTQGTQGINLEPLRPQNPALPHAVGRSAFRGAPASSSAGTETLITARADGEEDELPTAGLAHEVE